MLCTLLDFQFCFVQLYSVLLQFVFDWEYFMTCKSLSVNNWGQNYWNTTNQSLQYPTLFYSTTLCFPWTVQVFSRSAPFHHSLIQTPWGCVLDSEVVLSLLRYKWDCGAWFAHLRMLFLFYFFMNAFLSGVKKREQFHERPPGDS